MRFKFFADDMLWLSFTVIDILDLTSSVALHSSVEVIILSEAADPASFWEVEGRLVHVRGLLGD